MKKLKQLLALFAVVFFILPLCACEAEIDCYYVSEQDYFIYEYHVRLSNRSIEEIESTAADNQTLLNGGKWTLLAYFESLAEVCGWNVSGQKKQPFVSTTDEYTTYTFRILQPHSASDDEDDEENSSLTKLVDKGFYFTTVTYSQPNPLYESYKNYRDGTAQERTITYVLKNGFGNCPALETVFPSLAGALDNVTLNFYWRADGIDAVDGSEVFINGKRYLKWTVSDDNTSVAYSYRRPNPVGWYVTVALIGIVVTVIIILATRKSKKQPKMVDERQIKPQRGTTVYYLPPDDELTFSIDVFEETEAQDQARRDLDEVFGFSDDENSK